MTPDPETVERVARAIAEVVAARRADGIPAVQDQRRAEARAAIEAMPAAVSAETLAGLQNYKDVNFDGTMVIVERRVVEDLIATLTAPPYPNSEDA